MPYSNTNKNLTPQQRALQNARNFYANQISAAKPPEEPLPQSSASPTSSAPAAPPVTSPTTASTGSPEIIRDGASFAQYKGPLDSWKDYQKLKEAALKVTQMQQGQNQDLTDATAYWRGLQKDTTAFGSQRDPVASTIGAFEDEDFRLMSPADQASVRLSRHGAAQAHLGAIEQERQYRERLAGTALDNIREIYGIMQDDAKTAQSQVNLDRDFRLKMLDAGIGGIQELDENGNLVDVNPAGIVTYNGEIFNFNRYATDKGWGGKVQGILAGVPTYEDYGGHGTSNQPPTSFDAYLMRNNPGSGLIGYGREIARQAQEKGIPPEVLMAVINHESTYGTSDVFKKNNNPGGVTWFKGVFPDEWKGSPRPSSEGRVYVKFPTIADGISSTALSLRNRNRENYPKMIFPGQGSQDSVYKNAELLDLSLKSGVNISELQKMSDDEKVALDRQYQEPQHNSAVTKLIDDLFKGLNVKYGTSKEVIEHIVVQLSSLPIENRGAAVETIRKQNEGAVHPTALERIISSVLPDVVGDSRYNPNIDDMLEPGFR